MEELLEYFEKLETIEEHNGYKYSVKEAIIIVILGSFCGFKDIKAIHEWANDEVTREFLLTTLAIKAVPSYFWLLSLLKIIKPESFNLCFNNWVNDIIVSNNSSYTVAIDGKTICSTLGSNNPLHIITAYVSELGLSLGQLTVPDKTNEIPVTPKLINMLNLEGHVVVADALNCQIKTAEAVIEAKADYLLSVKENHLLLYNDIKDYIQDKELKKTLETVTTNEMNGDRFEKRTAYVCNKIDWLVGKNDWKSLAGIGAINTQVATKKGISNEWHYYIFSKQLTPPELLKHARLEWGVESMHWLLDVHFNEDGCRLQEKNILQNLNIIRKLVLNCIKLFKEKTKSKKSLVAIMRYCLIKPIRILDLIKQT